jgi:hypothetical protein
MFKDASSLEILKLKLVYKLFSTADQLNVIRVADWSSQTLTGSESPLANLGGFFHFRKNSLASMN